MFQLWLNYYSFRSIPTIANETKLRPTNNRTRPIQLQPNYIKQRTNQVSCWSNDIDNKSANYAT